MRHPLWPADGDSSRSTHPYVVAPSLDDPRLVLPTRPHRAARAILHALRDSSSSRARARTAVLRAALVANARTTQLPEPPLLGEIAKHLDGPSDTFVAGVHLGPRRANRKPVLAIASRDGTLMAFAKCGVDPLTDRLVTREAAALNELRGLSGVQVPALVVSDKHSGHPFIVQTPVPTSHRQADPHTVATAQVAVAAVGAESLDRRECVEAIAAKWEQRRVTAPEFAALADRWCTVAASAEVPWGSWHGDWRVTNMAVTRVGCSVWDWERFAIGVPFGYDALHLYLTTRVPALSDLTTLGPDLRDNASRLLRPFGVMERPHIELVTTGYLLELAGRYLDDDQEHSGARLGAVRRWLLPHLQQIEAATTQPGQGRTRS
jgi:hypothetical protein